MNHSHGSVSAHLRRWDIATLSYVPWDGALTTGALTIGAVSQSGTWSVGVNNFPATQPISAASLPLPSGASTEATLATRLTEATFDARTGALGETAPATDTASAGLNGRLQRIAQRLSSLIALLPAALVGGRLDVNIGASPATVPISAASLPLPTGATTLAEQQTQTTALQLLDNPVKVYSAAVGGSDSLFLVGGFSSGTNLARFLVFSEATPGASETGLVVRNIPSGTQAISAASLPLPADAATQTTLAALNTKVTACNTGAVTISAALPAGTANIGDVDVLTLPALPAGTNNIGDVDVLTLPAIPAGNNNIGDVDIASVPTLTKGTQGSTGFSTQDLKDAGRSQIMASWEEVAGTAAAESSLTNFTLGSRGAAALTAASSITVTAGKTLRIQAITIYVKATSTVNNLARFRLRQAGTVANNSPVIFDRVLGLEVTGTIAAGAMSSDTIVFPDGLEVAAGQQVAFTWFTSANSCTVGLSLHGYEY